jgi:signal transduction histidine kinase
LADAARETGSALDERRLRSLIDVGRTLLSNLDVEAVLRQLLDVACELTDARYAAVGILNERREELERFITLGIDDETRAEIGDLPRGRGVLGILISEPHPLRLDDVGHHPRSFGFPPGHPPMRTFLGVPILIRGEAFGNLYLTEKEDGEPFTLADEQSAMVLADWAAIAIDNARLYKTVWDRRQELERAVAGLEATTEIARALGGETELERVLELITKRGRALVDARAAVIVLAQGVELEVAAVAGEADARAIGLRIPAKSILWGDVVRSGRTHLRDEAPGILVEPSELGLDALAALMVPLVFRGKTLGVLAAFDRVVDGPGFSSEDERLIRSFASTAATAVHTAQSVEEDRLRRSLEASEQERRRWARELHDETLQGLGGLRVLLASAVKRGGDALEKAAREAIDQTTEQIESLRALIAELRPAALDELGLEPAIRGLADRTAATQGLAIDVETDLGGSDADFRLDPECETVIYRLVQEALNNVAKHARAQHVTVKLTRVSGQVQIEIRDDGHGFDPEVTDGGFGLMGMRERAALVGGTVEIESRPGEGTAVRAVFSARPARAAQ